MKFSIFAFIQSILMLFRVVDLLNGLMSGVFINDPGDSGSIPG